MRATALFFYFHSTKYDKIVVTEFVMLGWKSYILERKDAILWALSLEKVSKLLLELK